MAERNILGILILLSLHQTYAALDVSAPSIQRVFFTRDTVLICSFSVDKQLLDLNFLIVLWTFQGKVILRYDNKVFSTQVPRMSLNVESLGDGYASLHISNVSISDRGTYMCTVIYNAERKEKETSLKVFAKPLLSIQSTKVQRYTENTLTCKSTGFFPPDILITWYRNGEVLRNNFMGNPQIYKDGTYHVDSTMTITPTKDDQNQTFSCKVQHDSLQEPLQEDFQLIYEDIESSSNVIIVICIVLVLMIIIAGLGIFLWRRKCIKKKDIGVFPVMDIEGPTKLIAGEETSLYCRATNCPENTSVTWLEKRGGEVYEIPESHGGDKEEEERLMGTQYGVISCREGPNLTSSLKFRPNVTNHKDVTFICRHRRGKEKKEKTFHCRDIYVRPHLSAPMTFSLDNSGDVVCSVVLEKFQPEGIQIKWSCGVGNDQELDNVKTETVKNYSENTFNCKSECHVPKYLFQDPGFRVRVAWTHMSLDQPESREVSSKDLPWRPVIGEITVPPLVHGTEATMKCVIRGYFSDNLEVKWLRREAGKLELYEVSANDKYKIPIMEITQEPDNTYTCTTSLLVSISAKTEQGAEFFCRVTHPGLEGASEKRTGDLTVKGKPVIRRISSHGRYIILEVDGFYMQDPAVTWEQSDNQNRPYTKSEEKRFHNIRRESSDGGYNLTSICEALTLASLLNPEDKYIKATIEHGALESAKNIYFLRSKGCFYKLSGSEKIPLDQTDRETLPKFISNNHLKVSESENVVES